ncbi:adhesion G-protein coupled receptor G4 [Ictalurus punctatus]|uniref:Adhesion G-protein coupled receptor G4 n=1 Tax=Ictalurus punctatus TaxID=7998 RepID=A0A9F7QUX6_ICTPU|nr:adhesion G-protein coupled receptor G4 [Ictalurus punctatus]
MAAHHFQHLLCLCALLLVPPGHSYFMIDSKAVLQGFMDRWTLKENQQVPKLYQMTVCLDVRLLTAGRWMAFSYIAPRSPYYDLALQGDSYAVYIWLLGVQHRFRVPMSLERWHRLCLRIDSLQNSFSLTISSSQDVHQRTVIINAMRPNGKLQLGFHPWEVSPGSSMATIELYLFRVWGDVREHSACEDGTIVGWDSSIWRISQAQTWVQDNTLSCSMVLGTVRVKHSQEQTTNTANKNGTAITTRTPIAAASATRAIITTILNYYNHTNTNNTPAKKSPIMRRSVKATILTAKGPISSKTFYTMNKTIKTTIPIMKGTTPIEIHTPTTTIPSTAARNVIANTSPIKNTTVSTNHTKTTPLAKNGSAITTQAVTSNATTKDPIVNITLSRASNPFTTTKAVTTSNVTTKDTTRKGPHSTTPNPSTATKLVTTSNVTTKDTTRKDLLVVEIANYN